MSAGGAALRPLRMESRGQPATRRGGEKETEKPEVMDDILDILSEMCDRCRYPLLEKDQEKLLHEHCEVCPLEAQLTTLAAKACLHGQIQAGEMILRGTEPARIRR